MTSCVRKAAIFVLVLPQVSALPTPALAQAAEAAPQAHVHTAPPEGPVVALRSLIDAALDSNLDLLALRDQVSIARQRPAQERGLMPPTAEAQIWQWPINTLNPANTNMYMFMVGQDVPGRGKRDARAAVASKDAELASADVSIRSQQIVNEVTQAYTALYIARKATEIHLASVDLLGQIADAAQSKYASGKGSQMEALKPVIELSKLHNDVIMHDQESAQATARLNVLLNRPPETPIGPLEEPRDDIRIPESSDLQQLAIEHQPELQRARIEMERADAEVTSARLERKPDFNVQGGYLLMPNQTDGLLARVGITWPNAPWSRDRIDARIAEHSAMAVAARSRARATENRLRFSVQDAYVRVRAAQDRAALLRTTIVPQSEQAFDVARSAYQSDRGDFQSVLDAERMLLGARLDYYKALTDFAQARADLERAVGVDLAVAEGGR